MISRIVRLLLLGVLIFLPACNVSTPDKPDTLTFDLPDSLKASWGKYDSVRLDLYSVTGTDTLYLKTLLTVAYENPAQLKNLPLPEGLGGNFLVRVIAFEDGKKTLDRGVVFTEGQAAAKPVDFIPPRIASNRAPTFISGLQGQTLKEGEILVLTVKARDEDGDSILLRVLNLDSLLGRFPGRPQAISVSSAADSLVLRFDPGAAPGNYRFRLVVSDSAGANEVQVLTLSVGKVNRPPTLSFTSPGPGPAFRVQEGKTLSLRIVAIDPDNGDLTRLLPIQMPWAACGSGAYDTATGTLTFSPRYACVTNGELAFSNVVFRAIDNGVPPETGEIAASITIEDINTAPQWSSAALSLQGKEGRPMVQNLATHFLGDVEQDSVTFTASCGSIQTLPLQWSFTPGFQDSGQKICVLTATDSHVPPASAEFSLSLSIADSARALEVDILAPTPGMAFRDSVIRVSWEVEGVPQIRDTTEKLLKEGPHVIRRSFRDSLGNEGFDTVTAFLDTKPPKQPEVRSPGWTNQAKPKWTWKSGGEGGSGRYRVRLDTLDFSQGGVGVDDTAYTAPWNLTEGRHVLYVQERDAAGNWSATDSGTARVDLTAPVVAITTPKDGHVTNLASLSVDWTVDAKGQATFTQTLVDGGNTITRSVTDSAGNTGSASITVTRRSKVVFVNAAAAAGGDGNSWATATSSLQAGLAKAQSGWDIWVAKGSYSPLGGLIGVTDTSFVMKVGVNLLGGFKGTESEQAMRDWSAHETILTGEIGDSSITDNLPRILTGANNATLDGFTIQRGCAPAGSESGAMVNQRVSPNIRNCIFQDNTSRTADQGVAAMYNEESSPTIHNCTFKRNRSLDVTVMWNLSASPVITKCRFSDNQGDEGSEVVLNTNSSAKATFADCIFSHNLGRAITNNGGLPSISNCVFYRNSSGVGGGAIWGASGTISNSLFIENSTQGNGGALTVFEAIEILNCTFYGNTAVEKGGAIFHRAIEEGASLTFRNSIFWANRSAAGGNSFSMEIPAPLIASYSNFQNFDSSNAGAISIGLGMLEAFPSFLDISNPAGPDGIFSTPDDGLNLFGGPCVNSGDPAGTSLPATDITGGSRVLGARVDMGPYEN